MPFYFKTYGACFVLGALVALTLTPLAICLARRWNVLDKPGVRKLHSEPLPLLGGLTLFVGMWVPLALLAFWDNLVTERLAESWPKLMHLFGAGLTMLALGAVDDKYGLNALWKFMFQIPVAVVLVYSGVSFGTLTVPGLGTVELGWLGPVVTVLWIVGVTNALNLIDGIDGLATGVALSVSLTTAVAALLFGNDLLALVMLSMAGACLGFLRYNFNPAKIYLGDSGSLFLGMTLAVVSVQACAKGTLATSLLVPVLALGYPVADTLLALARRSLQGKSWFTGDCNHIHHRLLAVGLNHGQAALVLYGVSVLFCLLALGALLEMTAAFVAGVVVVGGAVGALLWQLGFAKYLSLPFIRHERAAVQAARQACEEAKRSLSQIRDAQAVAQLLAKFASRMGAHTLDIVQPSRAVGSRVELHWSDNLAATSLVQEVFRYEATGLTATFGLARSAMTGSLRLEYLALLSDLFYAAGRRMAELLIHASRTAADDPVSGQRLETPLVTSIGAQEHPLRMNIDPCGAKPPTTVRLVRTLAVCLAVLAAGSVYAEEKPTEARTPSNLSCASVTTVDTATGIRTELETVVITGSKRKITRKSTRKYSAAGKFLEGSFREEAVSSWMERTLIWEGLLEAVDDRLVMKLRESGKSAGIALTGSVLVTKSSAECCGTALYVRTPDAAGSLADLPALITRTVRGDGQLTIRYWYDPASKIDQLKPDGEATLTPSEEGDFDYPSNPKVSYDEESTPPRAVSSSGAGAGTPAGLGHTFAPNFQPPFTISP